MSIDFNEFLADKSYEVKREYAVLASIAHLYYDLGMLQPEIAERFNFSRSKVSRLLQRALDLGIVEIRVHPILDRVLPLENAMKSIFGLKDAVVVSTYDHEYAPNTVDSVMDFAATYVADQLQGRMSIGITNGDTISAVVEKLQAKHDSELNILQLLGAASNTSSYTDSRHLVDRMLTVYKGTGYYMNMPLYIGSDAARDALMQDINMSETISMTSQCDLILTGIGHFDPWAQETAKWASYQDYSLYKELEDKGAVGSICAQYYDIEGHEIDCAWNRRCMCMPLQQFKSIDKVIGVATGPDKDAAILGALYGHYINVLVTDAETARRVMDSTKEGGWMDSWIKEHNEYDMNNWLK